MQGGAKRKNGAAKTREKHATLGSIAYMPERLTGHSMLVAMPAQISKPRYPCRLRAMAITPPRASLPKCAVAKPPPKMHLAARRCPHATNGAARILGQTTRNGMRGGVTRKRTGELADVGLGGAIICMPRMTPPRLLVERQVAAPYLLHRAAVGCLRDTTLEQ